ncbi:MAG: chromosome segregation protein SMC [Methylophilus sp.]|nr:chromosome segregation protein SMC [Methylophilus sp.]
MRLTHLKLAGFKSFVDPTTIHLHGQRVGVVGPNGCGKSNVMESVRWVLGESSAKEMRADAMDAVIFNGSSNRKPISRASVELIFDNSMGGASGEWNQYAEISVKRVIEREKGSSYFINNTAVRRRDVADLFLGTGLGGRAYAIIGQNTISRIVEAKPEELRIFLEEAAGISKYKERRRETELRLRDTRENLTRVEDICRELQKTINKLESQAIVAEKFHALQTALKHADGQLWLLKKRDAGRDWDKTKANVEKLANQLEAQIALLRGSENQLETTRQAHYAASEGINKAQATYYESNAEVANLENQLRQTEEARERMRVQLQQLESTLARNAQQQQMLEQQLAEKAAELTQIQTTSEQANSGLQLLMQGLPEKDAALKEAITQASTSQQALMQAKQRIQIEQNNVQYLSQSLQEIQQRISQYVQTLTGLTKPDLTELNAHEQQQVQLQTAIQLQEQLVQQSQQAEASHQTQLQEARQALLNAERAMHQAEAEARSLEKLQQSLNQEAQLSQWLNKSGLEKNARLWEQINIDPAWRAALESVLGAKLNALIADKPAQQRPPSALVLGFAGISSNKTLIHHAKLTPLISFISTKEATLNGVLSDWLAGVYVLDDDAKLTNYLAKLNPGECLVNALGDIYTANSVTYHGAQTQLQGVLERQQQLESVKAQLPNLQALVDDCKQRQAKHEQALHQIKQQQQQEAAQLRKLITELHAAQLNVSRLKQSHENALQRETSIHQEKQAAQHKLEEITANIDQKQQALNQLIAEVPKLEQQANAHLSAKQHAESAYFALRDDIQKAEKTHQEFVFNLKLITNIINELNNKLKVNYEEKSASLLRQSETESTLTLTPMETLKANLLAAVNQKQIAEAALASARNHLAEQDEALQTQERLRLQHEQQLHPLRDALEQSRLKEQEARLHFEQCLAGLQENGLPEHVLAEGLANTVKTSELANKTMQLQREIDALGAVNLAAIQELAVEKERKVYLDSQMLDLSQASQTLEDAIRKIDKETRGKLQTTFDEANRNFNELFNVLFGGGQAKLELLGEEILDTGIQVFAQPPGKKNTTIQLLSGGEKALTAMALVFALFRLNPAPFCLMDEVDAPLDDSNTERFCSLVKKMSERTQFLFVSHNKITMEMAQQLIGVTMQESGVSRIVDVDIDAAMRMQAA